MRITLRAPKDGAVRRMLGFVDWEEKGVAMAVGTPISLAGVSYRVTELEFNGPDNLVATVAELGDNAHSAIHNELDACRNRIVELTSELAMHQEMRAKWRHYLVDGAR